MTPDWEQIRPFLETEIGNPDQGFVSPLWSVLIFLFGGATILTMISNRAPDPNIPGPQHYRHNFFGMFVFVMLMSFLFFTGK